MASKWPEAIKFSGAILNALVEFFFLLGMGFLHLFHMITGSQFSL